MILGIWFFASVGSKLCYGLDDSAQIQVSPAKSPLTVMTVTFNGGQDEKKAYQREPTQQSMTADYIKTVVTANTDLVLFSGQELRDVWSPFSKLTGYTQIGQLTEGLVGPTKVGGAKLRTAVYVAGKVGGGFTCSETHTESWKSSKMGFTTEQTKGMNSVVCNNDEYHVHFGAVHWAAKKEAAESAKKVADQAAKTAAVLSKIFPGMGGKGGAPVSIIAGDFNTRQFANTRHGGGPKMVADALTKACSAADTSVSNWWVPGSSGDAMSKGDPLTYKFELGTLIPDMEKCDKGQCGWLDYALAGTRKATVEYGAPSVTGTWGSDHMLVAQSITINR